MEPNKPDNAEQPSGDEQIARYYSDPDTRVIQQQLHHALGTDSAAVNIASTDQPAPMGDTVAMDWGSPEID